MLAFLGVFFLVLLFLAAFSWGSWDDCTEPRHHHHHHHHQDRDYDYAGWWIWILVLVLLFAGWSFYSRKTVTVQQQPAVQVAVDPQVVPSQVVPSQVVPSQVVPSQQQVVSVNPVPVPRAGRKMVFISSDTDSDSD